MKRYSIGACVLALVAVACGGGADEDSAAGDTSALTSASGLAKQYASMVRSEVQIKWDDGRTETLFSTLRGFVDVEESGESVRFRLKPCSFTLPTIEGTALSLPEETLRTRGPELVMEGHLKPTGATTTFTTLPAVILVGLRDVETTGPLPTDPRDPRVIDQDGDRDPGFSLRATKLGITGRVFVGLRGVASATGEISADGSVRATGSLRYDLRRDVAFYGDSIPFVDAAQEARNTIARLTPVPGGEKHGFRFQPIQGDPLTDIDAKCAAVARAFP